LLNNQTIKSNDFIIAPNPTTTIFAVYLPTGIDKATITLYTTLGQVVTTQNMAAPVSNVSLEGLNSGVYFYKLESNSLSQSGKIIKE
jgi:serine protease AprX